MITLKLEMNGVEYDIKTRSAIERSVIALVTQAAVNAAESVLTDEEKSKVTMIARGQSLSGLDLHVYGPTEIVDKIGRAMNAKPV